eukprot:g4634.t1
MYATFCWVCVFAILHCSSSSSAAPTKASRIEGAYFGALVADALCLGTHYEYDAQKISGFYGTIDTYYAPGEKTGGKTHGVGWGARNYHGGNGRGPPKRAGENTDYGDYQSLMLRVLYERLPRTGPICVENDIIPVWRESLKTWRAWMCTMTKQTAQQVDRGVPISQLGGRSNAMAVRFAAAYAYFDSEEDVVDAAHKTMFTHRDHTAHEGAEFFARVTHRVVHQGLSPEDAIDQVAAVSSAFVQKKVEQAKEKVLEATDPESDLYKEAFADDLALTSMARLWDVGKSEPIRVGKASPTEGTLPGSVYFILKYANDFLGAVSANSAVGGDNASRGVAIGMVLGAHLGVDSIPKHLRDGLVEWTRSAGMLRSGPVLRQARGGGDSEL